MLNVSSLNKAFFHHRFDAGEATFSATLFAKPENWSLSLLGHEDRAVREEFSQRLGKVLGDLRVGTALAPSPLRFTDRIIHRRDLSVQVPAGSRTILRNPQEPADGVLLEPGDAYVVSPSSCPITLMVRGSRAVALHTGRDCLIDRHELQHGTRAEGRCHSSICFAALERLGGTRDVQVKVFWGIPGQRFRHDLRHPTYGAHNETMYEMIVDRWGPAAVPKRNDVFELDLPKLIRDQCRSWGVPDEHIDLAHAYQPPHGTWQDGARGTPRNLCIIARKS